MAKNKVPLDLVLSYIAQIELAEALDITSSAISQWRLNGIPVSPINRVLQIERLLKGRVTRYEMRPDVYV